MTKSQTNTFSKYCDVNTKKGLTTYTRIIQGPYNQEYERKTEHRVKGVRV